MSGKHYIDRSAVPPNGFWSLSWGIGGYLDYEAEAIIAYCASRSNLREALVLLIGDACTGDGTSAGDAHWNWITDGGASGFLCAVPSAVADRVEELIKQFHAIIPNILSTWATVRSPSFSATLQ